MMLVAITFFRPILSARMPMGIAVMRTVHVASVVTC